MSTISFTNVRRKIVYQKVKRANTEKFEEVAYKEFDDCEIITQKFLKIKPSRFSDGNEKEYFATYKWYDTARSKLLQRYDTLNNALIGHLKWCQKEIK